MFDDMNAHKVNLYDALEDIVNFRYGFDSTDVPFTLAKLFEEGGEFAAASNTKAGNLGKEVTYNDHSIEEAADVIIAVLDTLAKVYKHEYSQDQIFDKLTYYLKMKKIKWLKREGFSV